MEGKAEYSKASPTAKAELRTARIHLPRNVQIQAANTSGFAIHDQYTGVVAPTISSTGPMSRNPMPGHPLGKTGAARLPR